MQRTGKGIMIMIIVCIVCLQVFSPVAYSDASSELVIVTTTTVLESIVKDLLGDSATVIVIASPTLCPAHYDIKPSDVYAFQVADLILAHGFEPWVKELKEASGTTVPIVYVSGPWNTPDALIQRYITVSSGLEQYLGLDMDERLERAINAINETRDWLLNIAEEYGFDGVPVVSMQWQKNFVEFLGFKIVATYGPPEMVSASDYVNVIENATKNNAVIVIDNLQSGTSLGEKIAKDIGGVEVALTNFPGTAPDLNNMTSVMKYNAKALAQALEEAKIYSKVNTLENEVNQLKNIAYGLGAVFALLLVYLVYLVSKRQRG